MFTTATPPLSGTRNRKQTPPGRARQAQGAQSPWQGGWATRTQAPQGPRRLWQGWERKRLLVSPSRQAETRDVPRDHRAWHPLKPTRAGVRGRDPPRAHPLAALHTVLTPQMLPSCAQPGAKPSVITYILCQIPGKLNFHQHWDMQLRKGHPCMASAQHCWGCVQNPWDTETQLQNTQPSHPCPGHSQRLAPATALQSGPSSDPAKLSVSIRHGLGICLPVGEDPPCRCSTALTWLACGQTRA